MKATGIVRKVDQLGRIVLPIELRRTLGIEIRDPLELKELIAEVNDTQVAGEEILSYSLYEYRRDRGRVDIVLSGDMKKAASA